MNRLYGKNEARLEREIIKVTNELVNKGYEICRSRYDEDNFSISTKLPKKSSCNFRLYLKQKDAYFA